jgi:beta-glucosidase
VYAQQKIQYQLGDKNFGPIYIHHNLPSDAIYRDTTASAAARAKDVLRRLNFEEKLQLTGGWNYVYFRGVPHLGLRPLYGLNSSRGIHIIKHSVKHYYIRVKKSTAFPSELALAATWDPKLAYHYAKSIGEECRAWGVDLIFGPGLNMYRNSEGGRNVDYMGEDPFLTSKMAVQYVKGLQSTGTLAVPKHFIVNDQEFARHIANVKVGERALREIYLPPFLAVINKGGALAIMNGNNFVNGYPGAADKPISQGILRKEYGYKGIIMSDWANSTFWLDRQNLLLGSGESLLMSNNKLFSNYVRDELKKHPNEKTDIEKGLDKMVFHNLYAFFKMGFYDRPYRNPYLVKKINSHKKISLKTAEEAITLLKNKNYILPIDPGKVYKIVVLGTNKALTATSGTGSSHVKGYDQVDYLTGLKNVYGDKIIHSKNITDSEIEDADVILYFISKHAGEGGDVPFSLPDSISNDILRCSRLNKNIVVIYSGGNGFAMPWISKVKGLVFAYLLGQESGTALANVISGKVNPSGKLPFTIEKSFKDSPAHGYNKINGKYYWGGGGKWPQKYKKMLGFERLETPYIEIPYREGIYIGYRWYEKKKITPQFPFGFGLSYTAFKISDIRSSSGNISQGNPVRISFKVKNTGKVDGAEITQLYIHKENPKVDRPIKELKGFKRVFLKPGESKTVHIPVHLKDLAFWSTTIHQWKINLGKYLIEVGTSSTNIRQKITININKAMVLKDLP